jgi:hypothetical protein
LVKEEHKFRKDFTPEQYAAYLEREAKNPVSLIPEYNELSNKKLVSKKKTA